MHFKIELIMGQLLVFLRLQNLKRQTKNIIRFYASNRNQLMSI